MTKINFCSLSTKILQIKYRKKLQEKGRQKIRQTETDGQTERGRHKQSERQTNLNRETETVGQVYMTDRKFIHLGRQTDKQTETDCSSQMDRQRETNRNSQIDRYEQELQTKWQTVTVTENIIIIQSNQLCG